MVVEIFRQLIPSLRFFGLEEGQTIRRFEKKSSISKLYFSSMIDMINSNKKRILAFVYASCILFFSLSNVVRALSMDVMGCLCRWSIFFFKEINTKSALLTMSLALFLICLSVVLLALSR